jgi:GDP-L-fucose synthase
VQYKFDTSKPSGFPRRIMDIKNAKRILNYNPQFSLKQGLQETWNWYCKNQDENYLRHSYFK